MWRGCVKTSAIKQHLWLHIRSFTGEKRDAVSLLLHHVLLRHVQVGGNSSCESCDHHKGRVLLRLGRKCWQQAACLAASSQEPTPAGIYRSFFHKIIKLCCTFILIIKAVINILIWTISCVYTTAVLSFRSFSRTGALTVAQMQVAGLYQCACSNAS